MSTKQGLIGFFLKLAIFFLLDQITKLLFKPRDFLFGYVRIHEVQNSGLSFGLSVGNTTSFVIALACLVLLFLLFFRRRSRHGSAGWAYALVFAGGSSNLLDRIVFGFVRDNIDLGLGFTFNPADTMIFTGLLILLFDAVRQPWKKLP